jgi:hypothetical protein
MMAARNQTGKTANLRWLWPATWPGHPFSGSPLGQDAALRVRLPVVNQAPAQDKMARANAARACLV